MFPVETLTVRRTEFPPVISVVGDEDEAAAAGAGEGAEDGSLSRRVRRTARLFPIGDAATGRGAKALGPAVRNEEPAAAGAYGLYVHTVPRSIAKQTRKKGRVKSGLRIFSTEYLSYAVTATEGAKINFYPPVSG